VIDGLDAEQVWVQLGLANDSLSAFLAKSVARACVANVDFELPEAKPLDEDDDDDSLSGDVLEGEDEEEREGEEGSQQEPDFFNAGEMERFVQDAEARQGAGDEEEEDDLDLLDGEGNEEGTYRYDDFFGENGEEVVEDEFDFVEPSKLEVRGKELAQQVATLEENLIKDKHWALGGEVTKAMRPENSLLDSFVDFDHVAQGVPVLTEEHTQRIEALVRKRTLEGTFDDVVRRTEDAKKWVAGTRTELQFGKSDKGLGQVFEEAYLKATADSLEENAKPEHAEAHRLFRDLCASLDALTNDHYRPSAPVAQELIVKSKDVAAVVLEEVAPIGVSGAVLLAPEEMAGRLEARKKRQKTKKREPEKAKLTNSGGKEYAKSTNFFRNLQEGEQVRRREKPAKESDAAKYKL
jgi:U3 small nucleolar RNA-associated protein MPP10